VNNADLRLATVHTLVALLLNLGVVTLIVHSLESPTGDAGGLRRHLYRVFAGVVGALVGVLWLAANDSPFNLPARRGGRPHMDTFAPLGSQLVVTWVALSALFTVATAYFPKRPDRTS
jgi:hypothetical protein